MPRVAGSTGLFMTTSDRGTAPDWNFPGGDILLWAVERDVPVELFRSEQLGRMPAARGRLIAADGDELLLDEVQTIGRDVVLPNGRDVEAYFVFEDKIFHFSTVVAKGVTTVQLNDRKTVAGMSLRMPRKVLEGQRRNSFRVSLALQTKRIHAFLFPVTAETAAQDPEAEDVESETCGPALDVDPGFPTQPPPPTELPVFTASAVDGSESGLGLVLDGDHTKALSRFEQMWIRLKLPSETVPITLLGELRQARLVSGGRITKLGVLLLPWPNQRAFRREIRPFTEMLREAQRSELLRRKVG